MDLAEFKYDKKKSVEGVWVDLDNETSLLVARMNNPKYREMFQREFAKVRHSVNKKVLDEESANQIMLRCKAETILLDWKGLKENGEELEYSKETAHRVLNESEWLNELVEEIAREQEFFKAEVEAHEGKSSALHSIGTSDGEVKTSSSKK